MQKRYLPTPKQMFSMFSNFLVFFVYPVLYTPHTVFRFLSFFSLGYLEKFSIKPDRSSGHRYNGQTELN
jgi:hypothetical protein